MLLLCALLVLPSLVSCVGQIEDTNGEDTTLCTLTDADITKKKPSHNAVGMVRSTLDGTQTLRVSQLSGVYEFDAYLATGEALSITLSTTLYEGNLRAVLLMDGVYLQDIPLGEAQRVTVKDATGRFQVRLAAESAKLDATLSFDTAQ